MSKYKVGAALKLLGLGWYVAFCIVAGVLLGRWLDSSVFHTSFWFTLIGLGLGVFLAFWGLYKALTDILGDSSNANNGER